MNKIFTTLLCLSMSVSAFAQWNTTAMRGENIKPAARAESYYSLNLTAMRNKLSNAQEMGKGATPVIISVPTMGGKIEKFAVYSNPVVVKSLADKYQLGSYSGVGVDDPEKYIRFSVSPYDFQSMIFKNGETEFVEPMNKERTVYGVHPKTEKAKTADGSLWICPTGEQASSSSEIEKMLENGQTFTNNPANFLLASDQKYRTMRLAVSANGEYTQYFGGVSQAISAIHATMTRINGVYEKDFALHLDVQDFQNIIYTDPATDPYTNAPEGSMNNVWNNEVLNVMKTQVGDANFDIGHVFIGFGTGSGVIGSAGCIGCVCFNGTVVSAYKGSAFSSPAFGIPEGDGYDIDIVAHEMGHQVGSNHIFSFDSGSTEVQSSAQNVEPGSGSTIMGYPGVAGGANVQQRSDPYFHINNIIQVQTNLNLGSKTCDIETAITNQPPVITAMPNVTIPKSTPFVLTAEATDPEGDPMTYTWEQTDDTNVFISNPTILGTLTTGPTFRSWKPDASPTRYFPKFSTVLAGEIRNDADWEAVPTVARTMNFRVTARDNNANANQQQTANAALSITVDNAGPFKINTTEVFTNTSDPVTWNVVGTNAAPFNVPNVKVDYTTDGGNTWTVLAASTANDGSEAIDFSSIAPGTNIYLRISAIDNIFYALTNLMVSQIVQCDGSAPVALAASAEDVSATISCGIVQGTPT
ncbi:MAG: M12 family metallo-peptidase, partial [Flavobacteriaceae bacterium]|nr:M12 family metallo-peptidase [Flavobacteriaceae bacterium]